MSGDPVAGQRAFSQCRTCHSIEPGTNRVGPSLHNIVGRPAGTMADYNYSTANKNSGVTWDEQSLLAFLESPRAFMPGTKMAFAGMRDAQQRADVIAYLKSQA